jgi:hypothetical protein
MLLHDGILRSDRIPDIGMSGYFQPRSFTCTWAHLPM